MKIRTGFVSNSSSSSFCILGYHINEELFSRLQEKNWDSDLSFYEGDEEGFVCGVYATSYLEEDKLPIALQKADKVIKEAVGEEDYKEIIKNNTISLIYDGYYS